MNVQAGICHSASGRHTGAFVISDDESYWKLLKPLTDTFMTVREGEVNESTKHHESTGRSS